LEDTDKYRQLYGQLQQFSGDGVKLINSLIFTTTFSIEPMESATDEY